MKVKVITVRKKEKNELVFVLGIQDENTIVDFPVDRTLFTKEELDTLKASGDIVSATAVYFGECEVYHLTKEYEHISIKIEEVEVV